MEVIRPRCLSLVDTWQPTIACLEVSMSMMLVSDELGGAERKEIQHVLQ